MKAQLSETYSAPQLQIGDRMPDILMTDVINGDRHQVSLSDFQGKLLILDFWSISCKGCIMAFPKYEVLQQKFEKDIFILPIALGSSKNTVQDFIEKSAGRGKPISLPTVVYENFTNNVFAHLFPIINEGVPVIVWINRNGILKAVTSSALLNEDVIRKMIENDSVTLPARVSRQKEFDYYKPFLVNNNGGADSLFRVRSILSPYSDSIGSSRFIKHRTEKYLRVFSANRSVIQLFQDCIYQGMNQDVFGKRVLVETEDSSKFLPTRSNMLSKPNLFCYELILPHDFTEDEAFEFMKDDLCRYFKVSASVETKEIPCLVISNFNHSLISKTQESSYKFTKDRPGLKLTNNSIKYLFSLLHRKDYPLVIDETDYKSNIDINIAIPEIYDFVKLKDLLYGYGLNATETKRLIDVLVIRDKK